MSNYEVIENYTTIERKNNITIQLNLMRWYGQKEKLDLRIWDNGIPTGKGITFTKDEWRILKLSTKDLSLLFPCDDTRMPFSDNSEDDTFEEYKDVESSDDDYKESIEEIDFKDFFVYSNKRDCSHNLIKIEATVPIYSYGKIQQITFDAEYCAECGVYYISEACYRNRIVEKGRLLCKVMSYNDYIMYKKQIRYNELKPESVLHMIGYTVNSKDNLSEKKRRTILQYAINEGVVTKERIISYLHHFLRVNGSKSDMQDAVDKWKSDLEWLSGRTIKKEGVIGVRRIIT